MSPVCNRPKVLSLTNESGMKVIFFLLGEGMAVNTEVRSGQIMEGKRKIMDTKILK